MMERAWSSGRRSIDERATNDTAYLGKLRLGVFQLGQHFVAANDNRFGAPLALAQQLLNRFGELSEPVGKLCQSSESDRCIGVAGAGRRHARAAPKPVDARARRRPSRSLASRTSSVDGQTRALRSSICPTPAWQCSAGEKVVISGHISAWRASAARHAIGAAAARQPHFTRRTAHRSPPLATSPWHRHSLFSLFRQ
jgi:hypothetical protein